MSAGPPRHRQGNPARVPAKRLPPNLIDRESLPGFQAIAGSPGCPPGYLLAASVNTGGTREILDRRANGK